MTRTAQNMQKLISRKYYAAEETALEKLDLLMLASRITDDEYTDLVLLAAELRTEKNGEGPTTEEMTEALETLGVNINE